MVFLPGSRVQWLVHVVGGRRALKDRADVAPLGKATACCCGATPAPPRTRHPRRRRELLLARIARQADA